MREALICDLDDTLTDPSHRQALAQQKKWKEFYSRCGDDPVNHWCLRILDAMNIANPSLSFFFVTGRPSYVEPQTELWLKNNLPASIWSNANLFTRPDKFEGETPFFKQHVYDNHIKDKYRVLFVLDDDQKVVDMYRSLGLTTLQPADNDW